MATKAERAHRAAPRGQGLAAADWATGRQLYLDNLKVVLVTAIIAIHAVLGYAGLLDVWSYTEVREVTLSPVTEVVLLVGISPFGFFMIALLFLVAGLLTRPSLERKGPGRFARDRLMRLGIPFAVYVTLIQPAVIYALERPLGGATGSYWYEFLGSERQIDTGPLWFVGVLLIFSLAYAAWVALRRQHGAPSEPGRISARHLSLLVTAVVPTSFLIRLVYPYGGESGPTDLNLWEWPACVALFAIGITASRQGWLQVVPDRLYRQCRITTLSAVAAMAAWLALAGFQDLVDKSMGGWHWPALAFAIIEITLTVFGSVWLLAVAQRHLNRPLRLVSPAVSRSAYGAFMLQTPVLIGLAVALRSLPAAAEVKAVIVATGGVVGSFALAWLLIRRVPLIARIL